MSPDPKHSAVARLDALLTEIRGCTVCEQALGFAPRPIVAAHPWARILIIGQAPGRRVHASGVPWDDASGARLREWMGIDTVRFYDPRQVALVPMGFCYPGSGASGDLPPRPECAPLWHARLLEHLPEVTLTLLLSNYALQAYAGVPARTALTEVVRAWREHAPAQLPLPHPSPRNNRWLVRNPWFAEELLPELKRLVAEALAAGKAR